MTSSSDKAPFFIVGCVRSGTTMLRNILRLHPNLACPEETHFFRWGDAFATDNSMRILLTNPVLVQHRAIDGISEEEFRKMLWSSQSRADLYRRYMTLYIERNKPGARRWFDKTPQNVYGAQMAAAMMPRAKFVHIVRNPLNVAASLRLGKVLKVERLLGAINYWNEADAVIEGLRLAYPKRLYEVRYEDFVTNPLPELQRLLAFLGEPLEAGWFAKVGTSAVDHAESGVLSPQEASRVNTMCRQGMIRHGYLAALGQT